MRDLRTTTRWSDADLDRALDALLVKSSLDEGSLPRVSALIEAATLNADNSPYVAGAPNPVAPHAGAGASPRGLANRRPVHSNRHRTSLLTVAAAVAVAVAVGVPLTLFHQTAAPIAHNTVAPLTTDACLEHNRTAHSAAPAAASSAAEPAATPTTSWYSPTKAAQLSMALKSALPTGTCMYLGSAWGDLTFPARLNPGDLGKAPQVGMLDAQASGRLVTAAGDGDLTVSIFHADDAKRCLTDRFDRTMTTADGTVIWQLTGSATSSTTKWTVLVVTAYQRNGTCAMLRVSDERVGIDDTLAGQGMTATGSTPLSIAELTALATAPGLATASVSDTGTDQPLFTFIPAAGRSDFSYLTGQRRPFPMVSGPDLTGTKTLRTNDYAGKVMVINFWGSWCAPCRAEADELRAASTALHLPEVTLLGVNVKDTLEAARAFSPASRTSYPSIYDPTGQIWQAISEQPMNPIPMTIVLDKQHHVAHLWTQQVTQADLAAVVAPLLAER